MTTSYDKFAWIENASYEELLRRFRYTKDNSKWFKGILGRYYRKQMYYKAACLPKAQQSAISEKVGWPRSKEVQHH